MSYVDKKLVVEFLSYLRVCVNLRTYHVAEFQQKETSRPFVP